ncbi:MAG: sugar phosphate isomerase/epimerase family protein [Planctomycetia bacterium]|nr:sugar phosphate isomerase/epimerase family protein [Planctomycetia bacterium]
MKYALCNEMFDNWSIENQIQAIASWGYDGVELAPFSLDPSFVSGNTPTMELSRLDSSIKQRVLTATKDYGIQTSGLHWILAKTSGYSLTSDDSQVRARTAEYLGQLAELCAELGGSYMVFGSPQQRHILKGQNRKEAIDNAAHTIDLVAPTLEQTGVYLALEALAPTETNFLNDAEETIGFIKRLTDSKWVTLHLDCKAMYCGEYRPIEDVLRYAASEIKMVSFHANDPNLQGPGFGRLDFTSIMQVLQEIGFDGWIAVEPFDYSPGVVPLGRKSIEYLKTVVATTK